MSTPLGTVTGLYRCPVKSRQGVAVDALELTARGVAGDRAYALGVGKAHERHLKEDRT